ncbi:DUF4913 domain-containing protein [Nocardia sputi]|uniref:DUF4913 domain-containing protein n=1 Tax=Nocardia sputi TaxID=2943705 RepID=UPI0020BFF00B|nr:DUF4913 domain-containing protein [Nocardia sputi]
MSASSTGTGKRPVPPVFGHFTDFAHRWLFPTISVRLAEANREGTYTWCRQWWAHRPVAVRIAHLHAAFEATRRSGAGNGVSTLLTAHIDPHMNYILDAANGPLHRCTRARHLDTLTLAFDPVPDRWFHRSALPPTTGDESGEQERKKPPRYPHHSDFVEDWLLPVTALRIAADHREGHYTWCRQWWRHQAVVVRFAALHKAFEAALTAPDGTTMSTLFVRHIDPHMKYILDAATGPLHRCTPTRHNDPGTLSAAPIPPAWFATDTTIDRLGFGPDFRALRP